MGCTAPFLLGTAQLLFKVADLICILTGRAVCKWMMTVLHEWVNTSHCSTVNRSPHPLFNGLWVAHPLAAAHSLLGCHRFEMLCVLRWQCGIAAEVLDWEWENLDSSWDPDSTSLRVYLVTFPLWALVSPSLKGGELQYWAGFLLTLTQVVRAQAPEPDSYLFCAWAPAPSNAFNIESIGLQRQPYIYIYILYYIHI